MVYDGSDKRHNQHFKTKTARIRSVFWEYVLIYSILLVTTCILLGLVLGGSYLRTLNQHQEDMLRSQATQTIAAIETQMKSMRELSLKLSVQRIFQRSYLAESNYHRITIAEALEQYQYYCGFADEFALIYRQENADPMVFLSQGGTADLDVFLRRCNAGDENLEQPELSAFLFDGRDIRAWQLSDGLLFAYPVHTNSRSSIDESSTLIFVLRAETLKHWVQQTSALTQGLYTLQFRGDTLIKAPMGNHTVEAGEVDGWHIVVDAERISLISLLNTRLDVLLFVGCILLLLMLVFVLAWYCYRPIRRLTQKYAAENDMPERNEFFRLNRTMEQMQTNTRSLTQTAQEQQALLRSYSLLMLLSGAYPPELMPDLSSAGIYFPYPWFTILTIMPCCEQSITNENIDVLLQNLPDITGDDDVLYAVECDRSSHTLAVMCNMHDKSDLEQLVERLHIYLNHLPRRFIVAEGSVTDAAGISASYLTAQSKLKLIAGSQTSGTEETIGHDAGIQQLVGQLVFQIECGDCQRALDSLEHCMALMQRNDSMLIRRYNIMNLTSSIQQLCSRLGYPLSDEQLSMLLPSNNLQSVHYEMLQLIPHLCSSMTHRNDQAIQPIGRLIMDYLNEHFCDYDISAQKIAEAIGVGINRTYAIIREQSGHSYKTVLTQLRIQQAKKLLLSSNFSVADIAEKVGYGSASYFIKVFKSSVGLPPDAYRRSACTVPVENGVQETPEENSEENDDII